MIDKWYCNGCLTKPQKLVTNNDIMDKLESMERRYNDLLNKYNEQIQINNQLKTEIIEIKSQLNKSEQEELKNNVIVLGIPYRSNENLQQVVEKMGKELQIDLSKQRFTATRMGQKENNKACPLKIRFENEDAKLKVIKSPRKINLTAQSLGYAETNKVFINQDLTKKILRYIKHVTNSKKQIPLNTYG